MFRYYSRGKRESMQTRRVERQIASLLPFPLLLKLESACPRPIPLPQDLSSFRRKKEGRREEWKERRAISAWSRNDCTGSPSTRMRTTCWPSVCLLPSSSSFLPSFLPPSSSSFPAHTHTPRFLRIRETSSPVSWSSQRSAISIHSLRAHRPS